MSNKIPVSIRLGGLIRTSFGHKTLVEALSEISDSFDASDLKSGEVYTAVIPEGFSAVEAHLIATVGLLGMSMKMSWNAADGYDAGLRVVSPDFGVGEVMRDSLHNVCVPLDASSRLLERARYIRDFVVPPLIISGTSAEDTPAGDSLKPLLLDSRLSWQGAIAILDVVAMRTDVTVLHGPPTVDEQSNDEPGFACRKMHVSVDVTNGLGKSSVGMTGNIVLQKFENAVCSWNLADDMVLHDSIHGSCTVGDLIVDAFEGRIPGYSVAALRKIIDSVVSRIVFSIAMDLII